MATTTADRLVVDASVAVKWYVPDEQDTNRALTLLQRFQDGQLELIAPSHIRYEVLNAITMASQGSQARLTTAQAHIAATDFLDLELPTHDDRELLAAALPLTSKLHIAYYDAIYLALAQRERLLFITADNKLHQRIRNLPGVVWLSDWST
jgi:predicted nucleic acid-binding protein